MSVSVSATEEIIRILREYSEYHGLFVALPPKANGSVIETIIERRDSVLRNFGIYLKSKLKGKILEGSNGLYKYMVPPEFYTTHDKENVGVRIYLRNIKTWKSDLYEPSRDISFKYKYDSKELIPIGEGTYGKVYQIKTEVIKFYKNTGLVSSMIVDTTINREISIISRLNHPNIIEIIDVIYNMDPIYPLSENMGIVMPLAEYNLKSFLDTYILHDDKKDIITFRILDGFNYIHSRDIIHGDIKEENILIFKQGIEYIPKISDFGLATSVYCGPPLLKDLIYSANYRPPEVFLRLPYDLSADLWAIGVLIYRIYTNKDLFFYSPNDCFVLRDIFNKLGHPPYPQELIKEKMTDCKYEPEAGYIDMLYSRLNSDISRIVKNMVIYDTSKRMKLEEVMSLHPFNKYKRYDTKYPQTCIESLKFKEQYPTIYYGLYITFVKRGEIFDQVREYIIELGQNLDILYYFIYLFDFNMNPLINMTNISYYVAACLSLSVSFKANLSLKFKDLGNLEICKDVDIRQHEFVNYLFAIVKYMDFDLMRTTWYDYFISLGLHENTEDKLYNLVKTKDIYIKNMGDIVMSIY